MASPICLTACLHVCLIFVNALIYSSHWAAALQTRSQFVQVNSKEKSKTPSPRASVSTTPVIPLMLRHCPELFLSAPRETSLWAHVTRQQESLQKIDSERASVLITNPYPELSSCTLHPDATEWSRNIVVAVNMSDSDNLRLRLTYVNGKLWKMSGHKFVKNENESMITAAKSSEAKLPNHQQDWSHC